MKKIKLTKASVLKGMITVPSDKSISHRAVMLSALCEGKTIIKNFLLSEDCRHTLLAFKFLGVRYNLNGTTLAIEGKGLYGFRKPDKKIYAGNSGTTIRLMLGILAGQNFKVCLEGDASLNKRPMKRVIDPLEMMGAKIEAKENNFPPLRIKGGTLKAVSYRQKTASAQVKSAVLLAGLYAKGTTKIYEKIKSRDHTERMLKLFSAGIKIDNLKIEISSCGKLISPGKIVVPNDFSSAAFFMAAAAIVPNSIIKIKSVGVNPTRIGFLKVLEAMGAGVEKRNEKTVSGEPRADLIIKFAPALKGINIDEKDIPSMIDELPLIMLVATQAQGKTSIKGAGELRVKETDRINSMATGLKKMGAKIEVEGNDVLINGPIPLKAAEIESFGDHRTAMTFAIAALIAKGTTVINNTECIRTSFPGFFETLKSVKH